MFSWSIVLISQDSMPRFRKCLVICSMVIPIWQLDRWYLYLWSVGLQRGNAASFEFVPHTFSGGPWRAYDNLWHEVPDGHIDASKIVGLEFDVRNTKQFDIHSVFIVLHVGFIATIAIFTVFR